MAVYDGDSARVVYACLAAVGEGTSRGDSCVLVVGDSALVVKNGVRIVVNSCILVVGDSAVFVIGEKAGFVGDFAGVVDVFEVDEGNTAKGRFLHEDFAKVVYGVLVV